MTADVKGAPMVVGLSIVLPAAGRGHRLSLLPGLIVPLGAGWIAPRLATRRRRGH